MSKKSDEAQDAKVMKNMTPGQMVEYKKRDKKQDKQKMSRKKDALEDNQIAREVKKELPAKKKKAAKKK